MNRQLAFLICSIIIIAGAWMVYIIMHEEVHRAIMAGHNCLDPEVRIGLMEGSAICNEYSERSNETALQEDQLHSMNELVSYNFEMSLGMALLNFIGLLYIIIFK